LKTLVAPPRAADRFTKIPVFHIQAAVASTVVLSISLVGCWVTLVHVANVPGIAIAIVLAVSAILPLPLYWHEKGKIALRDAAFTIPWALLLAAILPFPAAIAGRLGMGVGLHDLRFARMDEALGVSVPGIAAWGAHHWLGGVANRAYAVLVPMIPVAFLLPALTGKVKVAQEFLFGNLIAFAVGLPIFAAFPAVGPWFGYGLTASPSQLACQLSLLSLRSPGPYLFHLEGVICFPSFHVIWAILCMRSLWCFWPLRAPTLILCLLIILSTMTSEWHYFVDVLAGTVVALASVWASSLLSNWGRRSMET
jgi:PAP2 superfamily